MTVIVFARRPEHGRVKTRLAAGVGEDAALRLHEAFLQDTLVYARAGAPVVLARTSGPAIDADGLADDVVIQEGETFGARFDDALARVVRRHPPPYLIVGVDTPHLGADGIRRALHRLEHADVVIGPAPRGGFHLLGFARRPVPVAPVFDADDEVAALIRLCRVRGLSVLLTPEERDVDVPEDLAALARLLGSGRSAPRTADAMRSLGL